METLEELKKWVEALSVAEKRFIKLLGKARAGNAESQQLELLDWLNRPDEKKGPLGSAKFMHNLPTVANRLKDLILDGLRLLHKEENVDALLRTTLDEIAILFDKKLYHVVGRQVRRTKKAALEHCRYGVVLQAIEWEQRMIGVGGMGDALERLEELREEEVAVSRQLCELQEVRYLHEGLRARTRQSFPRDAETLRYLQQITENGLVERLGAEGGYLEQALAVNVLGMKDLCEGRAMEALARYEGLLQVWAGRPQWQMNQGALYLLICSQYQIACFYSPISAEEMRRYLQLKPDFKVFSPEIALDFQRILYRNQLTLSLNTGNFDAVVPLVAEIDQWLQGDGQDLGAVHALPFLHNLAIAEFLQGRYVLANRFVQRILNLAERRVRQDVRAFAFVLQAVVQFELGDYALTEYLVRAGRRQFNREQDKGGMELMVFGHLERAMRSADVQDWDGLVGALEEVGRQGAKGIPVIGVTELCLWAKAKRSGIGIKEVFLEAVRENLEGLE